MSTLHFSDRELACSCGCAGLPPQEFQDELEKLRVRWGSPLPVSSGFRCAKRNQQVSNTGPRGPHTRGAVDLLVPPDRVVDFLMLAIRHGWRGIGLHQHGPHASRFVHLDRLPNAPDCPRPRVWTYPK